MRTATSTLLSLLSLSSSILVGNVKAQDEAEDASVWYTQGAQSFYWHNRYHGCLAMAAYGDYRTTCPRHFTHATLQRQYPGNTNQPFEVVGEWGPTPVYRSEGFMVRVPEMNKILMVFKGVYGWQEFNATLSPLRGVGCDRTCQAHTAAIEAWAEVKNATNDMQVIKSRQGNLVWSASGHGFGAMIMQVAALDLKHRGFLFSAHSFGSPPVFNVAAARQWNNLFGGDASQRTVSNRDSIPASIPYHGKYLEDGTVSNSSYQFVNTGIHVFGNRTVQEAALGNANMYGQNYNVCLDTDDDRCTGGNNEADHYFYYTDLGSCCERGWTASYNSTFNQAALRRDQAAYNRTAEVPLLAMPNTAVPTISTTSTSSVEPTPNSTAVVEVEATSVAATITPGVAGAQNAAGSAPSITPAVVGAAAMNVKTITVVGVVAPVLVAAFVALL